MKADCIGLGRREFLGLGIAEAAALPRVAVAVSMLVLPLAYPFYPK